MNDTVGVSPTWAIVMIVAVPVVVIAAAELDERLRQRESLLRPAVQLLRRWVLPFFALWALLVPVLGVARGSAAVRLAGTGLVISLGIATLSVLGVGIDQVRNRPRGEGQRPVPQLLLALPRLAVLITTTWFLVSTVWGVDLSAALTALGVTSLVISFALQDTLSGLASGVLLLSDPPFRTSDWIESGDVEGVVIDVNWRTTRIQDRNGDIITVPNSELAGASIVNFSAPTKLHRVVVPVQVAYLNAPTLAKAMLMDAALGTPGVLAEPPPNVVVVQIDDPLMGYEVQMWVEDYAIAPRVKSDFGSLVWYQSHRHGVPLPSPAQDLYLYDGVAVGVAQEPTIPELRDYLSTSPLLDQLEDTEMDRLAKASTVAKFAVGELMLDSRVPSRDLLLLVEGAAQLVFSERAVADRPIGEVGPGDIIDLVTSVPREGPTVALRALTDCKVLVLEAQVVNEIGSRNTRVAAAFNRLAGIRRRRIERMLGTDAAPSPSSAPETPSETAVVGTGDTDDTDAAGTQL